MKRTFVLLVAAAIPVHVFAASLYFSPATKTVTVGQTFTVAVDVSSADQAMNAASGDVAFPSGKLRALSVSKSDSVMNLWVQDPTFTNAVGGGDINFAGVALNPGFTGVGGNIVMITFQAVATGDASLSFSDGSVLANDGNGTNILSSMGTADFTVLPALPPATPSANPTSPVQPAPDTTPPLPFIISSVTNTQNDPTNPQPIFTWVTTDPLSGIAKYMVKIGDGDFFNAATIAVPGTSEEYQLPLQAPAQNVLLTVDAYDDAGNMVEATTTFTVAPLPTPLITSYTNRIVSGETLFSIRGSMSEGTNGGTTNIRIYLQKGSDIVTYTVPVDQEGDFDFEQSVNLPAGDWSFYAQAVDGRGALSADTPEFNFSVGGWVAGVIAFILSWGIILAAAILVLAAIVALAYFLIYRGRRYHLSLARRLVQERKELRDDLRRIEKELEADHAESRIDLSAAGMHKKQEHVRHEIEHLEEDLKRDAKDSD